MGTEVLPSSYATDVRNLRIAREIAMDLNDIETILKNHQVEPKQWERIKEDPNFARVLDAEITAWNAAVNTHERTKLKAGAAIEEWLPEAYARLHDRTELLSAKTEVAKLLTRIAGMGQERVDPLAGGGGDRFTVTINLGADKSLKFTKEVTPKVIEGSAVVINDAPLGDEEA